MIKVQFAHGLESGPNGSKVQHMRRKGFAVIAPDMQMSLRRLDRENSVARNILRQSEPRAMIGLGLLAGAMLLWQRQDRLKTGTFLDEESKGPWLMLAGAGLATGVRSRAWTRAALEESFERCVAIQADAIARHRPDVLVGSSWGGAVSLELVRRGIWRDKPLILLAPAYRKIGARIGWRDLDVREEEIRLLSRKYPIALIHDPTDDTVPFADSEAFAHGSAMDFRRVEGGGHRLLDFIDAGHLDSLIEGGARRLKASS